MASDDQTNEHPTPGSAEAIERGCCCPAKQNNRGTQPPFPVGSHIGGSTGGWLIGKDCELHMATASAYRGALFIS